MKTCLTCLEPTEDLRHTCPHCGATSFHQAASGRDGLPLLDAMRQQTAAACHVDRAAQLFMQGRHAEAKAALGEALRINPMNATAHGNMGGILLAEGRPGDAIPWLEKALELNAQLEGIRPALARARAEVREAPPMRWWEFWRIFTDPS